MGCGEEEVHIVGHFWKGLFDVQQTDTVSAATKKSRAYCVTVNLSFHNRCNETMNEKNADRSAESI